MENQSTITPEKVAITFTLPNPKAEVARFKNKIAHLFSVVYNPLRTQAIETSSVVSDRARRFRMPKFNFSPLNRKKAFKVIFPLIIGVVVIAAIITFVRSIPDAQSTPSIQEDSDDAIVKTQQLNKSMTFPIKNDKGEVVGNFQYEITNVELRRKIIVQGKSASAIPGRIFMIFNLKIKNSIDKSLQLNTRDYIRVTVPSNPSEKLAADIHNDPVEVQAISTKYTRVGLAIDEEDAKKPIILQLGEIGGTKQVIELKFN